jgi:vancomycin resistance protein YoaR
VVVSANNISYKLVAPGDTFSFNELLGPISLDMGYVQGTIIKGDWAASDIGGGVCQVSTTVFRAAAKAGFQFEEWHPHSWRLGFYEIDGSPPGFDAAIYQPNYDGEWEKDLRFRNTLDSWLLLMLVVDGDTVRAHFYGRDPGWTVELGEAQVSEPKPIPDPVERSNAALAPGERRLVQRAQPGYLVRIRRTITDRDGNVLADGDFVSDYRSQPEAWEVG